MSKTTWLVLIAVYGALIGGITWGMFAWRQQMLPALDTVEARAEWRQWREASARQSAEGPVSRRPVRSAAPPTEVLLRDYFKPLLAGAIFFATLFYVLLIWIARGAARTQVVLADTDETALIARQTGQM